ncbi:peptidylprolyl isomerase [Polaribacter ponticola]|uniref:peptidylprolyl isomerase n=1 Tax=Polaribacter ponticola TaxID=2978475 RepID=A0ABT5S8I7_9FLAO|nr:peptidylprolyl isomerase [Polaribacter sp. MSW5]MDD7914408.1 peptidylprolyl isomerase [Polaribacter sp. MSW5]
MKKLLLLLVVLCSVSSLFSQKKSKVLLTIDDEKTTVSEFKRVYEKNLDALDNDEAKDVEKNLELFISYKLKVKEAYKIKLDTLLSYKREMEGYRNQLSAPYMQDSSFINKLVKDAYFRTKNEVKAKHILIRTPKEATPKDTLEAYNKIVQIRKRIVAGEDFEKIAVEVSEDPSARDNPKTRRPGNKGNLGYFSAFRMVYAFEDNAYKTKVGEISKPFKSRFGYHILKVDAFRLSRGEVEVAHILINDKTAKGEELINTVYQKLESDEQFKALARKYSTDVSSKSKGGKLRKFGSGVMVKSFDDVAFSLQKEGAYSKPFKTRFGWHIVQLIKKYPVQSFEELERELKNKVRSSERAQLSQKVVIDKLKKKYVITENENAKSIFSRKDIRVMPKDSLKAIILTINGQNSTQEEFVHFIQRKKIFLCFSFLKNLKTKKFYRTIKII